MSVPAFQIHLVRGPNTALLGAVVDSVDRVDSVVKKLCQFWTVLGVIAANDHLNVPFLQNFY